MISTENLSLSFGSRPLFESVDIKFTPGNCYGLIGANGAGKSTFLRCLSGELEPSSGKVVIPPGARLSVLKQDHFSYNEVTALNAVIMGHKRLFEISVEKDAIYAKGEFSDEDGVRAAELETEFADLQGWDAESNAAQLLSELGIPDARHQKLVKDLEDSEKVRVLLAQALFGNPDILLLDEPTNHLDVDTILWLEEFLLRFQNTVVVVSHDRHFLDKVCTHIADVDYQKVQLFSGNYTFWYETSQLALRQKQEANAKKTDKMKELQAFIQRFSANASKSRQASSRRSQLDKITLDDIKPSSRKYPYIIFKTERQLGKDVLFVDGLTKTLDGELLFEDVRFTLSRGEKMAITGNDSAVNAFMQILAGDMKPDAGTVPLRQLGEPGHPAARQRQVLRRLLAQPGGLDASVLHQPGGELLPGVLGPHALLRRRVAEVRVGALGRREGALHALARHAAGPERAAAGRPHQPLGPRVHHGAQQRAHQVRGQPDRGLARRAVRGLAGHARARAGQQDLLRPRHGLRGVPGGPGAPRAHRQGLSLWAPRTVH
jgi:ATPase subunit of ABC transporter with duplicated ATPase domains